MLDGIGSNLLELTGFGNGKASQEAAMLFQVAACVTYTVTQTALKTFLQIFNQTPQVSVSDPQLHQNLQSQDLAQNLGNLLALGSALASKAPPETWKQVKEAGKLIGGWGIMFFLCFWSKSKTHHVYHIFETPLAQLNKMRGTSCK